MANIDLYLQQIRDATYGEEVRNSFINALIRINNEVENAKSGQVDQEQVAAVIQEYLVANPLEESDPTVPAWAKQPEKPTYTAAEVGARTDNWMPTAQDVNADPYGTADNKVAEHNANTEAHNDIRMLIDALRNDKLDAAELTNAVNTALAQAKASGEFDGQDGEPGKDGTTPHIGDNGNWYIGDTDTGRPSRGEPGADGAPGQDGTDGEDGQDGAPGEKGDPGEDGRGIVSVTIKADGHLQVDYSDGTNVDAGKVVGENGLDGISGIPVRQEMTTEDTTVEIQPNKLYVFPEMTELTLTFAEPDDTGVANEYHVIFQSGATATTLTIPDTVKIPDSFVIDANKIYELSVMEGCLVAQSWEVV